MWVIARVQPGVGDGGEAHPGLHPGYEYRVASPLPPEPTGAVRARL